MPAVASENLASLMAAEVITLPAEKQSSVLDYVMFIKHQAQAAEDGDAAWERILTDARPRPKLEAFMKAAMNEGSEPMNLDRF